MTDAQAKWACIAAVVALDLIWLKLAAMTMAFQPHVLGLISIFGAVALVYTYVRPDERIATAFGTFAQMFTFSTATMVLTYLTASANYPLIDRHLAAADAALGLDWLAAYQWLNARPLLHTMATIAYHTFAVQIVGVLLALLIIGRLDRAREFVTLFMVSMAIAVPCSLFFPAASAWEFYGVSGAVDAYHLADFKAVRDGSLTELKLSGASGLITFPSLHTMTALTFIYVTRGIRYLFPTVVAINTAMLAATPIIGGHHFVDVIAGAAMFAIIAACFVGSIGPSRVRSLPRLSAKTPRPSASECSRR